jgi:hypothetical protein
MEKVLLQVNYDDETGEFKCVDNDLNSMEQFALLFFLQEYINDFKEYLYSNNFKNK